MLLDKVRSFLSGRFRRLLTSLAFAGALAAAPAQAAGLLQPKDGSLPALDLMDHKVEVVIEDGYAITTIDQTFANPHQSDMEAIYSFPVPNKAAVAEFSYWIDGKPVSGEIVKKERARKIYQQEKAAGREVGITEQDSFKTFDIKVWPVRAGQDVRIRLAYMQPASLDTGVGRYLYPLEEGGVDEERMAFWTHNDEVKGKFSFDLRLRPDYEVTALRLPKHPGARIGRDKDGGWTVHLDNLGAGSSQPTVSPDEQSATAIEEGPGSTAAPAPAQRMRLDTDIVVYWREKPGQPASLDLTAYKPAAGARGSFMLTLTPGMDLQPIADGRDWTFVLDRSGSMAGKIQTLAEGVSQALGKLRGNDRFRIFSFNDRAEELTRGFQPATRQNVRSAIDLVRRIQSSGGTNLHAGLKAGLDGSDADRSSAIILVTDGVANVGRTETRSFLKLVEQKDIRLFTAIMGNSANRPLLEPLTRASHGAAFSVSNSDDIVGVLLQATNKVTHQALNDMQVKLSGASGLRIADLQRDELKTLYRGEQLVLFGHYWGAGQADIELTGKIGGKSVRFNTRFKFPETAPFNPEIERLWAFARIEKELRTVELLGADKDRKQAVIDLSKEYGIVTPYTSMLVLREEQFAKYRIKRDNQKRLALEATQRKARASAPVRSRRVDTQRPMFQHSRPSHGGGGSGGSGNFGIIGLLLSLLGGLAGWRSVRKGAL